MLDAFDTFCTPKTNESMDRYLFFTRMQQPSENFATFSTDFKKLSSFCGFGDVKNSLIKRRTISGICDSNLKNCLILEDNLDLDKCIFICETVELAQIQMKTLDEGSRKVQTLKSSNSSKKGN